MIARATADNPAVLCLQEVPAWALGPFTAGAVAARPAFGPLPITAEIGRRLTEPNHGRLRSAFAGQGNAIHVSPRLRVLSHHVLTLNSRRFPVVPSRGLEVGAGGRGGGGQERRGAPADPPRAPGGRKPGGARKHRTG